MRPILNSRPISKKSMRLSTNIGVSIKDAIPEWPDPVFADFEVCPLEPEHKGEMRAVCVESAKNIFVQRLERTEK